MCGEGKGREHRVMGEGIYFYVVLRSDAAVISSGTARSDLGT